MSTLDILLVVGFLGLALYWYYRIERDYRRQVRELDREFMREAKRLDELEQRLLKKWEDDEA